MAIADREVVPNAARKRCSTRIHSALLKLFRRGLPRQLQRSPNRLNHAGIQDRIGMQRTKSIVKNLTDQRGTSEDTAGHGHRDSSGIRK